MSSDDVVISVRNLTKRYRMFEHPGDRLKQAMAFGIRKYHKTFTALEEVSFDVRKGEAFGIIGRNGSGKSTLLQLICGILKPTFGSVDVIGRVTALLELGAGFNPEFTGRENVYFQGALMGLAREEMDVRFDEIAAFADIGEFIDQPVRTYSSGMFVRLAFSVAVSMDPEIFIVDEALSVGDVEFQARCYRRIENMRNSGATVIMVSHDVSAIRKVCKRAVFLDSGKVKMIGDASNVTANYLRCSYGGGAEDDVCSTRSDGLSYDKCERKVLAHWGSHVGVIGDVEVVNGDGVVANHILWGEDIEIKVFCEFPDDLQREGLAVSFSIKDISGSDLISSTACIPSDIYAGHDAQGAVAVFKFKNYLLSGDYLLAVSVESVSVSSRHYYEYIEGVRRLTSRSPGEQYGVFMPAMQQIVERL